MTKKPLDTYPSEWSYPIREDQAGKEISRITIEPEEEDRARLCNRLNLLSLEKCSCAFKIECNEGNMIVHIQGMLSADVKQACVVTAEPVYSHIEEHFEAWYADPDKAILFAKERRKKEAEKSGAELPILEEHEDPEPIVDGIIDLGELAAQYLSLSLNPYPHAEGVEPPAEEIAIKEPRQNPFAGLKAWKEKFSQGDEE